MAIDFVQLIIRLGIAFGIIIASWALSYIATFIINRIAHIASKTSSRLDDEIINSIKLPIRIFFSLAGIIGANYYLDSDLIIRTFDMFQFYIIVAIIFFAFTLSRIISASLKWYGMEIGPKIRDNNVHDTLFPFVRKVITWIIYLIALIMILDRMGIEIGPLLAGLGVAGLAVALALQDTLSNFFSGISILSDKPVKVGEFVKIEGLGNSANTNVEGFVREIGWRSIRMETLAGDFIVIPNSKVAQSTVVNYSQPMNKERVVLNIGVAYSSDVEVVERAMKEAIKNVAKNGVFGKQYISKGFFNEDMVLVLFKEFGAYSLDFSFIYEIEDYSKKGLVNSEINKEIFKQFKKHKIEIPYPITTVQLNK